MNDHKSMNSNYMVAFRSNPAKASNDETIRKIKNESFTLMANLQRAGIEVNLSAKRLSEILIKEVVK